MIEDELTKANMTQLMEWGFVTDFDSTLKLLLDCNNNLDDAC